MPSSLPLLSQPGNGAENSNPIRGYSREEDHQFWPHAAYLSSVLHGLARGNVVPLHSGLLAPPQDRHRGQLG